MACESDGCIIFSLNTYKDFTICVIKPYQAITLSRDPCDTLKWYSVHQDYVNSEHSIACIVQYTRVYSVVCTLYSYTEV